MRLDPSEMQELADLLAPKLAELLADKLVSAKPADDAPMFLSVADAANRFGLPPHVLRDAIKFDNLPAMRFGRRIRLSIADVESWARNRAHANQN